MKSRALSILVGAASLTALGAGAWGCGGYTCGPGTVAQDGQCDVETTATGDAALSVSLTSLGVDHGPANPAYRLNPVRLHVGLTSTGEKSLVSVAFTLVPRTTSADSVRCDLGGSVEVLDGAGGEQGFDYSFPIPRACPVGDYDLAVMVDSAGGGPSLKDNFLLLSPDHKADAALARCKVTDPTGPKDECTVPLTLKDSPGYDYAMGYMRLTSNVGVVYVDMSSGTPTAPLIPEPFVRASYGMNVHGASNFDDLSKYASKPIRLRYFMRALRDKENYGWRQLNFGPKACEGDAEAPASCPTGFYNPVYREAPAFQAELLYESSNNVYLVDELEAFVTGAWRTEEDFVLKGCVETDASEAGDPLYAGSDGRGNNCSEVPIRVVRAVPPTTAAAAKSWKYAKDFSIGSVADEQGLSKDKGGAAKLDASVKLNAELSSTGAKFDGTSKVTLTSKIFAKKATQQLFSIESKDFPCDKAFPKKGDADGAKYTIKDVKPDTKDPKKFTCIHEPVGAADTAQEQAHNGEDVSKKPVEKKGFLAQLATGWNVFSAVTQANADLGNMATSGYKLDVKYLGDKVLFNEDVKLKDKALSFTFGGDQDDNDDADTKDDDNPTAAKKPWEYSKSFEITFSFMIQPGVSIDLELGVGARIGLEGGISLGISGTLPANAADGVKFPGNDAAVTAALKAFADKKINDVGYVKGWINPYASADASIGLSIGVGVPLFAKLNIGVLGEVTIISFNKPNMGEDNDTGALSREKWAYMIDPDSGGPCSKGSWFFGLGASKTCVEKTCDPLAKSNIQCGIECTADEIKADPDQKVCHLYVGASSKADRATAKIPLPVHGIEAMLLVGKVPNTAKFLYWGGWAPRVVVGMLGGRVDLFWKLSLLGGWIDVNGKRNIASWDDVVREITITQATEKEVMKTAVEQ